MKLLNFGITKGLPSVILLSLLLVVWKAGLAASYSPKSGTAPITTTVFVSSTPALVAHNGAAVITWSSPDSTSCTSVPSGVKSTSGSFTTSPLTATTTYTVTCTGPTGNASKSVTVAVSGGASNIAAAVAACVAEPMRGKVYYYCDCGTGAENGCVAGNDKNVGTSRSAPRQTIENAATRFGSNATNVTVALCKGGAFDPTGGLFMGSNGCGAGVACNTLREYTPSTFTGTAKPLINNAAGVENLIPVMGDRGGIRILNLKLNGSNINASSRGLFFYAGAHDVTMCNLDIDGFGIGIYNESNAGKTKNIKLTGSTISNSSNQGYLGGGDNMEVNYNSWYRNGSQDIYNHAVYFSTNNAFLKDVQFIGNYVYGQYPQGQYGDVCNGVVVTGHAAIDGFRVENNTIELDANKIKDSCWGMGFGAGAFTNKYLRNTKISNNTIKNGGTVAFTVAECPGCVIENNLIIQDWTSQYSIVGMAISEDTISAGNDHSNANIVRNNTVWFGPNVKNGATGIRFSKIGTGHFVANNTVTYSWSSAGGGVNCYNYTNPLASYAFINNNHCNSAASYSWAAGRGLLGAWQRYAAGSGFDSASITGIPQFTAAGTNFMPAAGSPLISAGNSANGSERDFVGKKRPGTPGITVTLDGTPAIGAFER